MLNSETNNPIRNCDISIGLRMPAALHRELLKYAVKRQLPLSKAVREILQKHLEG